MAKGFENALTKMVRLLNELNIKLQDELKQDTEGVIVTVFPDGSGSIETLIGEAISVRQTMYNFDSPEQLMEYLEAGQLKRIMMSKQ